MSDGELTVKTLRKDAAGKYFLEAANPDFEGIRPKNSLEDSGRSRQRLHDAFGAEVPTEAA